MTKSNKSMTLAGNGAGIMRRFSATEAEAERLAGNNGARMVRAVLDHNGLHAIVTDGKATIEISGGEVAVSVNNGGDE